eukprot:scaffold50572_cov242-Isochrysis_galbana.AAC.1
MPRCTKTKPGSPSATNDFGVASSTTTKFHRWRERRASLSPSSERSASSAAAAMPAIRCCSAAATTSCPTLETRRAMGSEGCSTEPLCDVRARILLIMVLTEPFRSSRQSRMPAE